MALGIWLEVLFYFSADMQLYQIQQIVKSVSQKTLIRMLSTIRIKCKETMDIIKENMIFGGDVEMNSVVEIDESCFGKKTKV